MMRQAFRSYIASLHPRNTKQLKEKAEFLWLYIILLFMYGIAALETEMGYADAVLASVIRLLPFFLAGWSNLGSKYLISKAMFLCPMQVKERKKYMNCVLIIKIGAMMLASVFAELIWSIFYGFEWWKLLIMVFVSLSMGIAEYVAYEFRYQEVKKIPFSIKVENGKRLYIGLNQISAIIAVAMIYIFTAADMSTGEWNKVIKIVFAVGIAASLLALLVLDIWIIKGQYRYIIEQSSDYELHFRINGKVESSKKYDIFA